MPLQATSGAASQDAFGGNGVAVVPTYIEEVFSTFLYAGTSAAGNVIINNIDLSTNGGLLWIKDRTSANTHNLFDNTRNSFLNELNSASTLGSNAGGYMTSVNTNGFTPSSNNGINGINRVNENYVSWTFRKQEKFFDVVTYTGSGSDPRNISHNLGSVPGCIIIKCTSTGATSWFVYHRSLGNTQSLNLNEAVAAETGTAIWGSTTPTSTVFTVGNINSNTNGRTYVAYLFAHNAGGFGLTGTDNVISCGSFTTDGSGNASVTLGYEPQWVMTRRTDSEGSWWMMDTMRGMPIGSNNRYLLAEASSAEASGGQPTKPNATGFSVTGTNASATFIYIAIRRGPMKVPTSGTSVFQPVTYSGNGSNDRLVATTITPDLFIDMRRDNIMNKYVLDRLRGNGRLYSDLSSAESSNTAQVPANTFNINQTGITVSADELNASGRTYVLEAFRRAPSFFDEVCYTGTGVARTVSHNLAAVPELMIVKERNGANGWQVYSASLTNEEYLILNTSAGVPSPSSTRWNSTTPTSTVFSVGTHGATNGSGQNFVNYLFATCAGVSKVGSYTGTAATLQIDCGFTGGARFVLIKRTDDVGDWYVWDSARGIIAGNDPYLLLNSTAAEVTSTDYIDTYSAGFEISSTAPAAINASGGSFIFLAIS